MGIVDIIIIVLIVIGGIIGCKRGVIKEIAGTVGIVLVTVFSFLLKNPVSIVFYENLPFFRFGGIFKGVTALNILLYELIAFLIVFIVLMILWKLVLLASGLIQRILDMSFLLGIPSKIIGFLVGAIEFYLICFVTIYILSFPIFNIKEVRESDYAKFILNDTPIISNFVDNNKEFVDEFVSLKEKYDNAESANQFNYETLDLFLKYDIIDIKSAKKLRERNKLKIDGIDNLLKKYEEE